MYRFAGAHFVSDAYSNIYAPLLPALIPRLGLSLAAAGTLAMLFQLVRRPCRSWRFGHLADRWRPRLLMVIGPIVSVAVLSLIGDGLVAAGARRWCWSPADSAARRSTRRQRRSCTGSAGSRRGLAMSIHITGGSLGYALAPLLFAPFVEAVGLSWTPLLAHARPRAARARPAAAPRRSSRSARRRRAAGSPPCARTRSRSRSCYLIVVMRTMTSLSLATFVPVLLTRQGWSVGMAGVAVSAYLFAASIGGFTGGPLADRFGSKRVIAGLDAPGRAAAGRGDPAERAGPSSSCWPPAGSSCSPRCR
ncbi:MAG: hypothetical protein MZU84_04025 [Sphingobacterium sp.]|nr:hypothetical protein [Sphingobacterium sp.]